MTDWKQTGRNQWRSTDGRLQIDRTTLTTTPRSIDAYGITLDGRDTCHASLTLASAQRFADRLAAEQRRPR